MRYVLGSQVPQPHFTDVGEPDNVEGCRGFFTFSVGTKDGRGESESLAEAGSEPEEELWVRGDLRGRARACQPVKLQPLTCPRLLPAMLKKRLARKPRAWTAGPTGTESG